jgi:hypothetical protein
LVGIIFSARTACTRKTYLCEIVLYYASEHNFKPFNINNLGLSLSILGAATLVVAILKPRLDTRIDNLDDLKIPTESLQEEIEETEDFVDRSHRAAIDDKIGQIWVYVNNADKWEERGLNPNSIANRAISEMAAAAKVPECPICSKHD